MTPFLGQQPGFDKDEGAAHSGAALQLPEQHAHLRQQLEATLQPLEA